MWLVVEFGVGGHISLQILSTAIHSPTGKELKRGMDSPHGASSSSTD